MSQQWQDVQKVFKSKGKGKSSQRRTGKRKRSQLRSLFTSKQRVYFEPQHTSCMHTDACILMHAWLSVLSFLFLLLYVSRSTLLMGEEGGILYCITVLIV